MKQIKWLEKNFELMILAIMLSVICQCHHALLFPQCAELVR